MTNLPGTINTPSVANETARPSSFFRLDEEFLSLHDAERKVWKEYLTNWKGTKRRTFIHFCQNKNEVQLRFV